MSILEECKSNSIVVDIYPLFLLAHLDQLGLLTKIFKKVYIHQSVMDNLIETIEGYKVFLHKGLSMASKVADQYCLIEISPDEIHKNVDFLEKIKNFINSSPEIEIKGFLKEKPKKDGAVSNILDDSARNTIWLAQELELPFYCDDRVLRIAINEEYKIKSFSSQTLFTIAHKDNLISLDKKYEIQKEMIEFNYNFISIDAPFIFNQLKNANYQIKNIQKIISNLIRKETDAKSLSVVLADLFYILVLNKPIDNKITLKIFTYI